MSTVLSLAGFTGCIEIEGGKLRVVGTPAPPPSHPPEEVPSLDALKSLLERYEKRIAELENAAAAAAAADDDAAPPPPPTAAARKPKKQSKRAVSEVEGLIAEIPDKQRIERAKLEKKLKARVKALRAIKAVPATAEQVAAGVEVQGLTQGTTLRLTYDADVRIHYVHAVEQDQYDTHTECHEKNTLGKAADQKMAAVVATEEAAAAYTTHPHVVGNEFHTHLLTPSGAKAGDVLITHMGNAFSEMYLEHIIVEDGHRGKKLGRRLLTDALQAADRLYATHHTGNEAHSFSLKHLSLAAESAHWLYQDVPEKLDFKLTDVIVYPWKNTYGTHYVHGRSARMLEYLYERAQRPAQELALKRRPPVQAP